MSVQPSRDELSQLANMRGAGKAHDAIRERYDPLFGIGAQGCDWTVSLSCDATVGTTARIDITVAAPDAETAERIAMSLARKREKDEWDVDCDADSVEIHAATIEIDVTRPSETTASHPPQDTLETA